MRIQLLAIQLNKLSTDKHTIYILQNSFPAVIYRTFCLKMGIILSNVSFTKNKNTI